MALLALPLGAENQCNKLSIEQLNNAVVPDLDGGNVGVIAILI